MPSSRTGIEFESLFMPHLDAAFHLARLLMRSQEDAEDVVQESYLKALRAFSSFHGEGTRQWLLAIVRNTCFTWLRDNRQRAEDPPYEESLHRSSAPTPEAASLENERAQAVERCIERLPVEFREAIVLRELEDFSYREIAEITGAPSGTVMSRLARARTRLMRCLQMTAGLQAARAAERT